MFLKELIKLAEILDREGLHEEASMVDEMLKTAAEEKLPAAPLTQEQLKTMMMDRPGQEEFDEHETLMPPGEIEELLQELKNTLEEEGGLEGPVSTEEDAYWDVWRPEPKDD